MKRLLLAGGGQAHMLVLREFARRRFTGMELLLVTPSNLQHYSGMLPGWIAGHYSIKELTIDTASLAQAAGARLIAAHVQKLDLARRAAITDGGETLEFDVLSIATGAEVDADAITGAREHAVPLRPFGEFVKQWPRIVSQAESAREPYRLTVIGGGAAGVETALAAAHRGRTMRVPMRVKLLSGGVPILPGHCDRARALVRSALINNGVKVLETVANRV
ncbi:MAG TPA: FAD-dependent oxidoreductase, partial [Burkholderiaceae bacterium]|nr:FAD-dependent oxidoreductase [Burkholderiaceae bacterium]